MRATSFGPQATTTWSELKLDGHIKLLGCGLLVYLLALVAFWANRSGINLPPEAGRAVSITLILSYVVLTQAAFVLQVKLNNKGLDNHGIWRIWACAVLLTPFALGSIVSLSVFLRAIEIKRSHVKAMARA